MKRGDVKGKKGRDPREQDTRDRDLKGRDTRDRGMMYLHIKGYSIIEQRYEGHGHEEWRHERQRIGAEETGTQGTGNYVAKGTMTNMKYRNI